MGASHHGSESEHSKLLEELRERQQRFSDQVHGTSRREYPAGRMGADDDGTLAYAITTDQRHGTVIIRFGTPVEWVALGMREVEELRDQLTERLMALHGVNA